MENNMFQDMIDMMNEFKRMDKNADIILGIDNDENFKINNPGIRSCRWMHDMIIDILTDENVLELADELKEKLGENLTQNLIETLAITFSNVATKLIGEQNQIIMDTINKRLDHVYYVIRNKYDNIELELNKLK